MGSRCLVGPGDGEGSRSGAACHCAADVACRSGLRFRRRDLRDESSALRGGAVSLSVSVVVGVWAEIRRRLSLLGIPVPVVRVLPLMLSSVHRAGARGYHPCMPRLSFRSIDTPLLPEVQSFDAVVLLSPGRL